MNIKKLNEQDYNALPEKPHCKVTDLELTWRQYTSSGLYSSVMVKKLWREHKDVDVVRRIMAAWVYFPLTNCHYPDARTWQRSVGHLPDDKTQTLNAFYDLHFRATNTCQFPGCAETVPYDLTHLSACSVQHYNQSNQIRKGTYAAEDLKFKCLLDDMAFVRVEDVSKHLRQVHKFNDAQMEGYYRERLMKPDDNHGFCKWCHKPTRLYNFVQGYFDFCADSDCNVLWHNQNSGRLDKCSISMKRVAASGDFTHTQVGYWLKRGFDYATTQEILRDIAAQRVSDVEGIMRRDKVTRPEAVFRRKQITGKWLSKFQHKIYFSPNSQKFFWQLWEKLKPFLTVGDVFFATFDHGIPQTQKNLEYLLETQTTYLKLDFYIPKVGFIIEYDDPAHLGRKRLDIDRDTEVKATLGYTCLIHRVPCLQFETKPSETLETALKLIHERI